MRIELTEYQLGSELALASRIRHRDVQQRGNAHPSRLSPPASRPESFPPYRFVAAILPATPIHVGVSFPVVPRMPRNPRACQLLPPVSGCEG